MVEWVLENLAPASFYPLLDPLHESNLLIWLVVSTHAKSHKASQ